LGYHSSHDYGCISSQIGSTEPLPGVDGSLPPRVLEALKTRKLGLYEPNVDISVVIKAIEATPGYIHEVIKDVVSQ